MQLVQRCVVHSSASMKPKEDLTMRAGLALVTLGVARRRRMHELWERDGMGHETCDENMISATMCHRLRAFALARDDVIRYDDI